MRVVAIDIPMAKVAILDGAYEADKNTLRVDLGHGCRLLAPIPMSIKSIIKATMTLELEVVDADSK